ncbi:MAG: imidazole glycerol phosphate synthase subunit HisH [Pseudomonadota bacterium]
MSSVAVIDYGMGNLHSIAKALQHVAPAGGSVFITAESAEILRADRVVFPGVGAIRDCMKALTRLNLVDVIKECAESRPLLGICLGMQALLGESEENNHTECLGILPGQVVHFPAGLTDERGGALKIPHMGWNQVHQAIHHPLWNDIAQETRFYFVHSYYASPAERSDIAATADYPSAFACTLARGNIFAVQFHPEKSQAVGLQLLKNFLTWDGAC